jgi:uncharacterized iron-regulated membrane protein
MINTEASATPATVTTQQPEKKKRKWRWARHQPRWWGKWHLYLGIFAGIIVSVVGATGSILVFQDEIDEALNPQLFHTLAKEKKIPLVEIVPLIRQKYPDLQFSYIFEEEDNPNLTYSLYDGAAEQQIFINPYTAEIAGKRLYTSSFISIVTSIHRTLLIPVAGRYIVGISSLILLILTITGLRLWIPQKWKQLKSVLTVNFKMSAKRQNYDWHNVLGFYSSPVVALLSLTGFCITFSMLVIPMLFILSGKSPQGVAQLLGAKSHYTTGATPLPLIKVADIAKQAMPEGRIAGIALPGPKDTLGNYRLDLEVPGLPKSGKRAMLVVDQYTGKILLNNQKDFPNVGNAYLSWLTPIHYGSFGGRPTQILALIAGLIPLALAITGFIIWWPRYKKQRRSDKKQAEKQRATNYTPPAAITQPLPQPARYGWNYFWQHSKKGFIYAGWLLVIGLIMGALYGLPSGIIIQPAVFTVAFTTVLVVLNFAVALLTFIVCLLFLAPFKKMSKAVIKYFAISLSFTIVFMLIYMILLNTGLQTF